ncbi:MAG TPA: OmpH family outer membrane protein [Candidatus Angelobacter sp.]|jgi:outer membrane protein|nr:OmpH family outer membrane protein [Candidatus Angelobacter sp.]
MASHINNRVLTVTLALGLGMSNAARAQAPAAGSPSGTKVGIVSIQDAIANTNEGKKELEALQQKFAPRQAALQGQNDEVENLKKQLQAQGDKLSEDERGNRVRLASEKQKTLQRNYEDFQNEVQQAEQEILNRLGKKMLEVLEKYAKDNNFAVVMDVSNPQTPVLYAHPGTNITKELIDAYNAGSPVAAPAAKPAAGNPPRPAGTVASRPPASGAAAPKKP